MIERIYSVVDDEKPDLVVPADRLALMTMLVDRHERPRSLRISHQPNFLAYWKLLGQFELADWLRSTIYPVNRNRPTITYVVNDYDAWSDERLRRAEFPSLRPRVRDVTYLRMAPVGTTPRSRLLYHLGVIPDGYPRHIRSQVEGYLAGVRELLPRPQRAIFWRVTRAVLGDVMALFTVHREWRAFCVGYIELALRWLDIPAVSFVSGYERFCGEQQRILSLAFEVASETGTNIAALLWAECSRCRCRIHIDTSDPHKQTCTICGCVWTMDRDRVIPKILLDNLLDDLLYPNTISLCHIGGLQHISDAHLLRSQLGQRSRNVDVVSDQGSRPDRNIDLVIRAATARSTDRVDMRLMRQTYDRARAGAYSSLYYFIGDVFASTMTNTVIQ